ncbi:MAG: GntR family transcriptional regulator [Pseudomonadota bacterium]
MNSADRVYADVRDLAVRFEFKPSERINEGQLAKRLGTSRTPLREALNRLTAEGFLSFRPGQGFYCRSLEPDDVLDLYELRQALETEGVRLAVERSDDAEIHAVRSFLKETQSRYVADAPARVLVDLDEEFHLRVMRLSGNRELERQLENANARTRFIRWLDMERRWDVTPDHHLAILEQIEARDASSAASLMRDHISRRREDAVQTVREAYSRIYVPG